MYVSRLHINLQYSNHKNIYISAMTQLVGSMLSLVSEYKINLDIVYHKKGSWTDLNKISYLQSFLFL